MSRNWSALLSVDSAGGLLSHDDNGDSGADSDSASPISELFSRRILRTHTTHRLSVTMLSSAGGGACRHQIPTEVTDSTLSRVETPYVVSPWGVVSDYALRSPVDEPVTTTSCE